MSNTPVLFNYVEKPYFFIICTGSHGPFGNYRAFPTLIKDVFRGIHTKTGEVRYFKRRWNPGCQLNTYGDLHLYGSGI